MAAEVGPTCWRVIAHEGVTVHTCVGTCVLEGGVLEGHFVNTDEREQVQLHHVAATLSEWRKDKVL